MSDHGTFVAVYPDGRRVRLRWPMRKQLDNMEISPETGASYPRGRLFFDVLSDLLEDDDEDTRTEDDEGDDVEKAQPEKETSNMDSFEKMVKDRGIVAVAKAMVDEQRAYGIDEARFTQLATESAQRMFPDKTPAAAFEKLFCDTGADGMTLRKAHALTKETTWPDLQPMVISGGDLKDANDAAQAMDQLREIGRRIAPTATPEKQFAVAFEDPKNVALALRVYRRPSAMTSFPFPR